MGMRSTDEDKRDSEETFERYGERYADPSTEKEIERGITGQIGFGIVHQLYHNGTKE